MKKEKLDYYDEFIKNENYALQIAEILKDYKNNFDSNKSIEIEIQVHQLENEADKNLHNISNYLIKDFLPPIERDDIITLINNIDDVVDNVDEVVINLNILNVTYIRDEFKEFIDLIYNICLKLKELLLIFKNSKKYEEISKHIVDINNYEEMGDELYQKAISNLFIYEQNPIEVIKWNTIYNSLEECCDSCEAVASCVDEIIMKNV